MAQPGRAIASIISRGIESPPDHCYAARSRISMQIENQSVISRRRIPVNKIRFAARRSFLTATACLICVACLSVLAQNTAPQAPPTPAELKVPQGFKVSVFASDVANARLMAVSPDGVLFV